ncbi:MAG: hypothetical protein J7K40_06265 [candidate division Zixibacteria bacterium]|nr:hypothetical protein [candidate division Zixibacteria bacterium]
MRSVLASFLTMSMLFFACGVYTFSPSALGGVKTIAIQQFTNNTTEYGINDLVADQVNQAFIDDNTLRVVSDEQADIILIGAVVAYSHEPYTYNEAESVQEYVCRISLKIKIEYADSEKILWEDNKLSDYGIYSVTGSTGNQTQDDANQAAIEKLVEEILNRTVKGW